jgi:hypothetical protein
LGGNSSSCNTAGAVEFPSSPSAGASPSAGGAAGGTAGASSLNLLMFVLVYFTLEVFYFRVCFRF